MLIKDVERYSIPIESAFNEARPALGLPIGGTTAEELIKALLKVPGDGVVSTDFGAVFVTHYKPDIEVS
ncbi:hypothetical protein SEA_ACOLYTE_42 [Mycobacterium phage Acolyte]|nr:hypothetical protein SEA_ACOLYTE_42 [Mycobacterium phage Acolyte]